MKVEVNILEASSNLADRELRRRQRIASSLPKMSPYKLLPNGIDDEDEHEVRYTEEAQEVFNELFDEYFNLLTELVD